MSSKRSDSKAFWQGFSGAFNLFPDRLEPLYSRMTVEEALGQDFKKVGEDMKRAMDCFGQDVQPPTKGKSSS